MVYYSCNQIKSRRIMSGIWPESLYRVTVNDSTTIIGKAYLAFSPLIREGNRKACDVTVARLFC